MAKKTASNRAVLLREKSRSTVEKSTFWLLQMLIDAIDNLREATVQKSGVCEDT